MRKVICDDCEKEFEPPDPKWNDEEDYREEYAQVRDLAKFDGWSVEKVFTFCPDCR